MLHFWSQSTYMHALEDLSSWWRHQMETFFASLAFCAGNSPVTGEFPTQRPVSRSFDVSFDLHRNKWLNKQSWGRWSDTPSRPLWRHCNAVTSFHKCNHNWISLEIACMRFVNPKTSQYMCWYPFSRVKYKTCNRVQICIRKGLIKCFSLDQRCIVHMIGGLY